MIPWFFVADLWLDLLSRRMSRSLWSVWPVTNDDAGQSRTFHSACAGQHRRVPDVVCLAQVGWTIGDGRPSERGQHGYDPAEPDMWGLFIATGPGIAARKLDLVDNIDVYPLLCRLLQVQTERTDASKIVNARMSSSSDEQWPRDCSTITVRTEQWMGTSAGWGQPLGLGPSSPEHACWWLAERLGQRWVIDGSGYHHGSAHGDQAVTLIGDALSAYHDAISEVHRRSVTPSPS